MVEILLVLSVILNVVILLLLLKKNTAQESAVLFEQLQKTGDTVTQAIMGEISRSRTESSTFASVTRTELAGSITKFGDSVNARLSDFSQNQNTNFRIFFDKLAEVADRNEGKMEKVREAVDKRLESIQKENTEKLEQMRQTVDEKLHETLEKRLGASFKIVSDRLEQVHKGLGEMQTLASGVGDLKKVLQNVKTRGTWGEVQLGNLLDQLLTPEQYGKNVITKNGSTERVEFAIKIPSKDEHVATLWMPIDAKFPLEDYQQLIEAEEKGDVVLSEKLSKALENRIKSEAKNIREKYINPPFTTDFGILFLPVEGLFAEVLRRPGLADSLQREYKVSVAGPTTISALLNSLQMGFRTLAIERRSSEVWSVLGAVKAEFSRFGDLLDKTHKKLQEASNTIEQASSKSRTIERKLGKVQEFTPLDAGEQKAIPGTQAIGN